MTVSRLLERLSQLQLGDDAGPLAGNYPSIRYHKYFPISRPEDNVYFVSWIHQLLNRYEGMLSQEDQALLGAMKPKAAKAISQYRNRYGDVSYNFYRPKAWFPNGRILSRFGIFQPTDDSDDSSIAYRGLIHNAKEAQALKDLYIDQANGSNDKWVKRLPKEYRAFQAYNTWIGSVGLYVDIDLVVISNILVFNALYDLPQVKQDHASIALLTQAIQSGDYLNKRYSLVSWYPFPAVIIYSLSDLIATGHYAALDKLSDQIVADAKRLKASSNDPCTNMLLDSALAKLGATVNWSSEPSSIEQFLNDSKSFSFGVIPLTHPWNGMAMQWLGAQSMFRMYYRCEAQLLAIYIEWLVLQGLESEKKKSRAS